MGEINTNYASLWRSYKKHVEKVVLTNAVEEFEKVSYWRNAVFCKILTTLTPLSLIALLPSVFMAFISNVAVVGFADLFAFALILTITLAPGIKLELRKALFIFILYCLSVTLLYFLPLPAPGLLFSLATTIVASLVYSSSAAYLSAWINTAVCIFFAFIIYFNLDPTLSSVYNIGSWIAISSNLVLLSFAFAKCLDLLLAGLTNALIENRISKTKLEKTNRLYQFISQINQTIVHVRDAKILFRKSCDIALAFGKYKMAWIGAFDVAQRKVTLLDSCGIAEQDIKLFVDLPSQINDPQDYVLRTGQYFLCNDIEGSSELKNLKSYALKHNIGSVIVLPIKKSGRIFGTLNLYASEINYFGDDDVNLLIEVTGDISFALDLIENEEKHKAAEIQLQENFAKLETVSNEQSVILNTLPASIALLDHEGNIVKVNDQWIEFGKANGLHQSYLHLTKNYIEISEKSIGIEAKDGKHMSQGLQKILNGTSEYFTMEYPCHSPIEKRWFKVEVRPIKNNLLTGAVVMHVDISDRKKAEAEMLLLINNTEESFILLNRDLRIVSFNNQFKNLYKEYFGVDIKKDDSIIDYVQPDRKEIVASIYEEVLAGKVKESEITVPTNSYTFKYFSLKYSPAKDELGNIFGVFVTAIDTTEKKKAEEQKEFERRDKEALINSTDDLIWSISNDLKLIAANNAFAREIKKHTGVDLKQGDELLRTDVFAAEYLSHWKDLYNRALKGESYKIEIYTPDVGGGQESWIETSFSPITINGKIEGIACYARDITERKNSELVIRASEARLAEAQSLAKIGNWETDLSTKKVIWSEQTYRIFDCLPGDFKSSHPDFLNFVHPDDRAKVDAAFVNAYNSNSVNVIEHRIITNKGEVKFVEERWQIFHDNNNKPVKAIGTCQDITERKKSERENLFKAVLLDTIGQAVIATDLSGNVTFWNKAATNIYGWSSEESIGKNILELTPSIQTKANSEKLLKNLVQGVSWSGEFYAKRKDGRIFPAFVYNSPVYDEFGEQIGVIGVSNDVSEQKELEEERSKITTDLLQRNRELEQFTFIISHNLRAPTANIIGFTEILQNETLTPKEQKELLHGLSSSVEGLDNIIKDINSILQVKREINEKKEIVNFSELANGIISGIKGSIDKDDVQITTDFSEVEEIFSLKPYLHSIFYNLISNSIKYRKATGKTTIKIHSKKQNEKTVLTFKDNGLGIDLKTKGDKVFGLYKRFHSHVEGKGMGLFMVKTQVEAIGGKIDIKSEVNKGTEFTIVFEN